MTLLAIRKLDAGYEQMQILKKIDIDLKEGDLAIIIGPNGSGKSTTVKSIFGLTNIFSGTITFKGEKITRGKTHEIVKKGIGYVPQGRLVFDTLTVEENLLMGGFGLPRSEQESRKEELFKMFPVLRNKRKQRASFLSGGQQQMLSIARALMKRPTLLLLDEPSLGLDPKTQQLIFKTIKDINKQGTTIMMVEQNAHQALKICSKAYVVENGKIAASGGRELARKKRIKDLYLGGR